jgi:hypothetical protein
MQVQDAPTEEQPYEDDESEELPPAVVIGTAAQLGAVLPDDLAAACGDRPVWFLLAEYAHLVGVFLRHREAKMPKATSDAILAALRKFSQDSGDDLQRLIGITDALQYGFHTSASIEKVRESFEEDGFEIVGSLRAGRVEPTESQA